jgi:serine protease Do
VIISPDGDVLTNNHVVEGASEIKVTLFDGREMDAEILGTDPNTDLALLKLRDASNLPSAQLGDSDNLDVGDWVMAIGNPFGLEATVTVGVLSGKGRVIGAGPYDDFLQTDTSINPGNSGGPLFNLEGKVVGINTAIIRGGQGIGFSIPINLAKDVSEQLKERGKVERGFIGVGIQPLTPALKRALSVDPTVNGALISSVLSDGPARAAGVEVSDIVVSVNGNKVEDEKQLLRQVAKLEVGSRVPIEVVREGRTRTLNLEIARRPNERETAQAQPVPQTPTQQQQLRVGVAVTETAETREKGVVVAEVMPNSPASRAGLRRGDRIRAVGNYKIRSAQDFTTAISQASTEDLAFLVEREGRTSFILIED